jgi:hypothetical protein
MSAMKSGLGFVEWFRPGEHERVLTTVEGLRAVGASSIRTHLSWADYHTADGAAWYDWLIPTLGRDLDLCCAPITRRRRCRGPAGPPGHRGVLRIFRISSITC